MASNTERRLAALEEAAEAREGLVVCLRDCGPLRDASEAERTAWLEAHPLFCNGPVLVKHVLDDAETL